MAGGDHRRHCEQELNVRLLTTTADEDKFVRLTAEPNMAVLGKRLGKSVKAVSDAVRGASPVSGHVAAGMNARPPT